MNGIPKGPCSFGGVQRRRLWSGQGLTALVGCGAKPHSYEGASQGVPKWDVEDAVPYIF